MPLIALLLVHATQSNRITLTEPGARVPVLLSEIGKAGAMNLTCSPVLDNEVVLLRVKEAPNSDVLAQIAKVVGGEWVVSRQGRKLIPSVRREHEERAELLAGRRKLFADGLAELQAKLKNAPDFTESFVRRIAGDISLFQDALDHPKQDKSDFSAGRDWIDPGTMVSPARRLITNLLSIVPPNDWIEMPEMARAVFSSEPTRMQRALPPECAAAIETYASEEQLLEKQLLPVIAKSQLAGTIFAFALGMPSKALSNDCKVDLSVSFTSGAQLTIVNNRGDVVVRDSVGLEPATDEKQPDGIHSLPSVPAELDVPLVDDPESAEFRRLLSAGQSNRLPPDGAKLMAKWAKTILTPDVQEPMRFSELSGRLIALAERLQTNLIAKLNDISFPTYSGSPSQAVPSEILAKLSAPQTGNGFETWYTFDGTGNITREPGWILLVPKYVCLYRNQQVDRLAMQNLLHRIEEAHGALIVDVSQYLVDDGGNSPILFWPFGYCCALAPYSRATLGAADELLHFYGLIPGGLRESLRRGPITLGSLPAVAREKIAELVYQVGLLGGAAGEGAEYYGSEWTVEPTEVLPNGIPPDGLLRILGEKMETAAIPVDRTGEQIGRVLGSTQFGRALAGAKGDPDQQRLAATVIGYAGFKKGIARTLSFRLEFAPKVTREFSFTEITCPPGNILAYSQLPAGFRADAERARIVEEKRLREANPDGFRIPPPHQTR